MTTTMVNGNGGATGAWDSAAIELINRSDADRRKRWYARKESDLAKILRRQIAVERRQRVPVETEMAWQHFCAWCAQIGEVARPAEPCIVAEHLLTEAKTAAEAERIRDSISYYHRIWRAPHISDEGWVAQQAPDPTLDILVSSATRFFYDCEREEQAELERHSAASKTKRASKKEANE